MNKQLVFIISLLAIGNATMTHQASAAAIAGLDAPDTQSIRDASVWLQLANNTIVELPARLIPQIKLVNTFATSTPYAKEMYRGKFITQDVPWKKELVLDDNGQPHLVYNIANTEYTQAHVALWVECLELTDALHSVSTEESVAIKQKLKTKLTQTAPDTLLTLYTMCSCFLVTSDLPNHIIQCFIDACVYGVTKNPKQTTDFLRRLTKDFKGNIFAPHYTSEQFKTAILSGFNTEQQAQLAEYLYTGPGKNPNEIRQGNIVLEIKTCYNKHTYHCVITRSGQMLDHGYVTTPRNNHVNYLGYLHQLQYSLARLSEDFADEADGADIDNRANEALYYRRRMAEYSEAIQFIKEINSLIPLRYTVDFLDSKFTVNEILFCLITYHIGRTEIGKNFLTNNYSLITTAIQKIRNKYPEKIFPSTFNITNPTAYAVELLGALEPRPPLLTTIKKYRWILGITATTICCGALALIGRSYLKRRA